MACTRIRGPISVRFWAKTVRAENGCLLWQGAVKKRSRRDGRGGQSLPHGKFNVAGKSVPAHRVAFMLSRGLDGHTMAFFGLIAHACDNPACVEPTHLEESTYSDNLQDAYDRGRRGVLVELCDWFGAQGALASRSNASLPMLHSANG